MPQLTTHAIHALYNNNSSEIIGGARTSSPQMIAPSIPNISDSVLKFTCNQMVDSVVALNNSDK